MLRCATAVIISRTSPPSTHIGDSDLRYQRGSLHRYTGFEFANLKVVDTQLARLGRVLATLHLYDQRANLVSKLKIFVMRFEGVESIENVCSRFTCAWSKASV